MKKSGLADSPLFQKASINSNTQSEKPISKPKHQERHQATTVARYHATSIESIRKAVRKIGKEAATYRFTSSEKKALVDIIYAYRLGGIKISENEITRIAINFLLNDYKANKQDSILDRVIEALNQ